ncbi:transposase [Pseudovibrio ascidiaceicola]|uniref:transposase n=1 Tax=Pseudovibrio ascidiaceicola TaxID=285279 RepID=UPI003D35C1F5
MGTKRGKYTDEYKAGTVDRLHEPGASLGKVAKELCLTPSQLKIWRLEREAAGSEEAKQRQHSVIIRGHRRPTYCSASLSVFPLTLSGLLTFSTVLLKKAGYTWPPSRIW